MTDEYDYEVSNEKKAKVFCERDLKVHITKKDGGWLNGKIESIKGELLILNEFKLGVIPIFFAEIEKIEIYNSIKKEKGDEGSN